MTMQSWGMGIRKNIISSYFRQPVVFWLIIVSCCIEVTLVAADSGLVGSSRWRALTYQNGAFWAGLLHNWRPNYAAQPWLMFLSYSFLHGGLAHLLGNMVTLVLLGQFVVDRVGNWLFLLIYFSSAIGGAVVFGLITSSPQPMVGASGALSGLAGAWLYWEWCDRRDMGLRLAPVWLTILALVTLNVVLWLMLDRILAWETHLGGAVTGCGVTALLQRRYRRPSTS